jgi:hypothetical protein
MEVPHKARVLRGAFQNVSLSEQKANYLAALRET